MTIRRYLWSCALIVSAVYFVDAQTAPQTAADLDYQTGAVLYMQKAAEYRALTYQAFNVARMHLDADFDKKNLKKFSKADRKLPRAIIIDIDETVLDNSPSQARGIKTGRPFNKPDWYNWTGMSKAKSVPGALEFLNYAVSKGVKVFFISNRDEVEKKDTIENLTKLGFKDVGTDNVMLRQTESGKDSRRAIVTAKYRVVLLVGDNLDDFSSAFERKSVAERFAETDRVKDQWGKRFIVVPNAMYGTWENAIYEYERLTEEQKAAKRAAALELP